MLSRILFIVAGMDLVLALVELAEKMCWIPTNETKFYMYALFSNASLFFVLAMGALHGSEKIRTFQKEWADQYKGQNHYDERILAKAAFKGEKK